MDTTPTKLKPQELASFINANPLSVVRIALDDEAVFNNALYSQLKLYQKKSSNIAILNMQNADYSDAYIQSLIKAEMPRIGLISSDTFLPGYYLFKKGTLAAYHPGTFDISKLDPKLQEGFMWTGLALAAIFSLIAGSFIAGLLTFSATMEASTGMNIFQFFKEVLEARTEIDFRKRQKFIFLSELDKAYALLKISKSATDNEVKTAWKKMVLKSHPDKNPDNVEAATKLTVQLNEAYDIITNHRKASKSKISFS